MNCKLQLQHNLDEFVIYKMRLQDPEECTVIWKQEFLTADDDTINAYPPRLANLKMVLEAIPANKYS